MSSAVRRGRPKIKPPRRHGSEISIDTTWQQLSKNIVEILNHNAANLSFEENHRFAYNMVLHKHGEMLYKGVNTLVAENLVALANTHVVPAFPTGAANDDMQRSQEDERLLKELRTIWEDHTGSMTKLGQVLKYMDRIYTQTADVPDIWNAGLELFIQKIIQPPIRDHVVAAILKQIQFERDGFVINRSAVKGCVDVFLSLKANNITLYQRDIEPAVLQESETFYQGEGTRLLQSCDAPEFLRNVDNRLTSEESRVFHYLASQTATPLRDILKKHLLHDHLKDVIEMPNSGLDVMIDSNKWDDLSRLYRLCTMVPTGLVYLRKKIKESITRRGGEINDTSLDESTAKIEPELSSKGKGKGNPRPAAGSQILSIALKWVEDVLNLKERFDIVWKKTMQSDRDIESTLTDAFQSFINKNEKSPEYISLFIDDNLKKGLKGKTEVEVDEVLDKTITVFRYLTEKDVFERYYQAHLAKRLLSGRSVSDDAERGMLSRLKVENGSSSTQKLESMFHDMKLSADAMKDYETYLQKTGTIRLLDLSVTVMTSTFWPVATSGIGTCTLPDEIIKTCESFGRFYLSRHTGRRLTWQPALGNADIRVKFKNGKQHEVNVSTYGMAILLLFEDVPDGFLTFEEIKISTSIDNVELSRQLQSLACAKFKILKKHPPGREVDSGDSFSFNEDFSCPLQKIKISTIASKVESGAERQETLDRIEEERKHQMDACIVRIMKDRKHSTHNELINEATKQLAPRFLPDPFRIKKRIESLIERDYLARCDDRKSYNYVA